MAVQLSFAETKWVTTDSDGMEPAAEPGKPASIKEGAIQFQIGAIPDGEFTAIFASIVDGSNGAGGATARAQSMRDTIALGLRGWRNVLDREGNAIEFKSKGSRASGESVAVIMAAPIRAYLLVEMIIEFNTVKRAELGNF